MARAYPAPAGTPQASGAPSPRWLDPRAAARTSASVSARGARPSRSARRPRAAAGAAHRLGARAGRPASSLTRLAARPAAEPGRPGRPACPCSVRPRLVGDEQSRDAVLDHLGNAADRGRDDGCLAGHRLEVDDPHRLVDRRADEHGRVAEDLDHVRLRQHLLDPDHAAARRARSASILAAISRAISGVSGAPAQSTSCASGSIAGAASSRCDEPLLARDPADEDDRRAARGRSRGARARRCRDPAGTRRRRSRCRSRSSAPGRLPDSR